jgi:hypothetical protein
MLEMSRRSLVTTAIALPALAMPAVAITNPASIGAAASDPIYAAISIYVESEEQVSKACEIYAKAEELFREEFGSPPDALNREWRGAWDERVGRSYTVFNETCNLWSDAAVGMLAVTPTSHSGIQALLSVVQPRPIFFEICKCHTGGAPQILWRLQERPVG